MKDSLRPGLEHQVTFRIPASKTVPALYPEAPEFQVMPQVAVIDVARFTAKTRTKAEAHADMTTPGTSR